ncbi:MAG: hypothetical protein KAI79_19225 [Bacteroidales bacterium]|nr:hypothetical protein [Bacteroidales bacterium]
MKKFFILSSILLTFNYAIGQVSGLSASKLGTLCTVTVPAQTIEFEPFFEYATSTSIFDLDGNTQELFLSSDSSQFFSSTGFRFSYGLAENLEIGVSLPVDVSTVGFGAKYKLPLDGNLTLGILAGYNSIVGNDIYVRRNAVHESTSAVVGGIIMTYEFTEKFSFDFNAQYQKHLNTTDAGHDQGLFLGSDFGYYLIENVNFITGFNYSYIGHEVSENNAHLLTVNPGIAIEKAENFILVLNSPIDLMGKNEYKTIGFGLALTIILD